MGELWQQVLKQRTGVLQFNNGLIEGKQKMSANKRQVAGNHYNSNIQHWDYVVANDLDYFQAQITKYVTRWKKKNGITDLLKAQHFLEKYIEIHQRAADNDCGGATSGYVNQDR
jgi:hypothetical protein